MAVVEILMPRMGESVMEGTILSWLKGVGDTIEEEESLLEVATDKVDTEIPSPYEGVIKEILVQEGDVVQVDSPIALIETSQEGEVSAPVPTAAPETNQTAPATQVQQNTAPAPKPEPQSAPQHFNGAGLLPDPIPGRFYSPLVLNIARKENIPLNALERIPGTGKEGRVTKNDILSYVKSRENQPSQPTPIQTTPVEEKATAQPEATPQHETKSAGGYPTPNLPVEETPDTYKKPAPQPVEKPAFSVSGKDQIIEMDRMRKIIAERMIDSRRISAHVTSFVEADVTNIVYWKNRMKHEFNDKEGVILTYTPIFIEAVIKAIKDYPMINVSVSGDKIIVKKDIHVGLAVALPDNNLIVPVIKHADQLNLIGLTKQVNDLAKRARAGKLKPEELEGGTFTVSNVGSFGNVMGTPIIVQPQVAILALGAVVKKPAVIETPKGDTVGIRHMMMLSHSYDHRVVDGSLGGMFVRRVADYLEKFDLNRQAY